MKTLPHIPDDLTLGQFLFDCNHPTRPKGLTGTPWLIEDATGRKRDEQEVSFPSPETMILNLTSPESSVNEPLPSRVPFAINMVLAKTTLVRHSNVQYV